MKKQPPKSSNDRPNYSRTRSISFGSYDDFLNGPVQSKDNQHSNLSSPSLSLTQSIIHNEGYCGLAAFGFLFYRLLQKGQITPQSHQRLYQKPISLFLNQFSAYYNISKLTLPVLLKNLNTLDINELQCTLAPVFKILLLHTKRILKDGFNHPLLFNKTTTPSFCPMKTIISNYRLTKNIATLTKLSNEENSCHPEHRSTQSTPLDLYILSEILQIDLSFDSTLANHDGILPLDQKIFFQNELSPIKTQSANIKRARMHIQFTPLETKNTSNHNGLKYMTGHFDIQKNELGLAHKNKSSLTSSKIRSMAALSHTKPKIFAQQLMPQLYATQKKPATTSHKAICKKIKLDTISETKEYQGAINQPM